MPAEIESRSALSSRECAIHLAMLNPQNMKENFFKKRERERERESKREREREREQEREFLSTG
jgi:hypothetical protein